MTTEIKWTIENLERQTIDGLVTKVYWRAKATDWQNVTDVYSEQTLQRGDEFIDFEELSQEQIIEWVKSSLGEEQVTFIENKLIADLEDMASPTVVTGLPTTWSVRG